MAPDNKPQRRRVSPDMLVAISALIVSVCAICVSIVQTDIMRRQQRADVWPHVSVGMSSDTGASPNVRFQVTNAGVGPAIIRWAELRLDDHAYRTWEALGAALTDAQTARFRQVASLNGRVLAAGETAVVHQPHERALIDAMISADRRIAMDVCYCSIQDECWIARLHDVGANEPIAECPVRNGDTFTQ